MTFVRRVEAFECEVCGACVAGDGFTNHCPKCLASKHVDIDPGDRESSCGGVMEVVEFERLHGELRMEHRCVVCGHRKWNRASGADSNTVIVQKMNELAKRLKS